VSLGAAIGEELDALAKAKPAELIRRREERFLAIGG
jgi:acetyl-CoA carboxylase carboxyl transferase subunit alpha